ncbi:MAG TPA: hypothetical protein VIG99_33080 [Myxococcaceae bacterium]
MGDGARRPSRFEGRGSFTVSADVAYERFLTSSPLYHQSSVLIGAGVGYLF